MKHDDERETLLSIYSDVFKDVHGYRPRGSLFPSDLSNEEIEAKLSELERELSEQIQEERYQEEKRLSESDEDDPFYTEGYDNGW